MSMMGSMSSLLDLIGALIIIVAAVFLGGWPAGLLALGLLTLATGVALDLQETDE